MSKRKVCVVSGSRAEYGLLYWLLKEIKSDPDLELQLVVTGMHLLAKYGATHKFIEDDGFVINEKIDMADGDGSSADILKGMGQGLMGFANAFQKLEPDIVVVLGDRYEVLVAAQAAMMSKIHIAHISGGEATEGAIDDSIRHCLSKMAHFHFVSAEPYRLRLIQMGESPLRVLNYGDPGIENIKRLGVLSRNALSERLGFNLDAPYFLVTYHPETHGTTPPGVVLKQLLTGLESFPDHRVVITKSNADQGGAEINKTLEEYAAKDPRRYFLCASLGQKNYLSAMAYCEAVIGNSSSGIVEAPIFSKPTVNIGHRQAGRLMADSIVTCGESSAEIAAAVSRVLSSEFKKSLSEYLSLYDSDCTSLLIKNYLKDVPLGSLSKKFYDFSPTTISNEISKSVG